MNGLHIVLFSIKDSICLAWLQKVYISDRMKRKGSRHFLLEILAACGCSSTCVIPNFPPKSTTIWVFDKVKHPNCCAFWRKIQMSSGKARTHSLFEVK